MAKSKLWGGRFEANTSELMDQFNASLPFDINLMEYDIEGSLAHVKMLGKQEILTAAEVEKITEGLKDVKKDLEAELEAGTFDFKEAEDIHSLVEARLTAKIGAVGGKLHTGRSRNDQVAVDMRLYLRDQTEQIMEMILKFMELLLELAEEHADTVMPGYTHLQRAQALTFGHHLLAYYFKLKRDYERFQDALKRINVSPLGSGALAGSSFNLDRDFTAQELGFERACENSMDGVSDRDFVLEFLSVASNLMLHLSRLSEEVILWNSKEFSFIELADQYTTGSSIMPQKKNPDLAELVRGKTGRVIGSLNQLLLTIKGLPLAYNKDLQEDKEGLFDSVDTLKVILELYPEMLKTMTVKKEAMQQAAATGFLNATELADFLAENGIPFRQAHQIVGEAVLFASQKQKELDQLEQPEWEEILGDYLKVDADKLKEKLSVEAAVNSHATKGGPAFEESKRVIKEERKFLAQK
ncbi:argininosuccinate lyase [Halanaerobium saccharolyticum]|uniref:Argininosuccinate lyase n=1 Tax=Halanaerobium saccharolyticum TaxID=43595 RepID=A0A4V3CVZ9_9FIRM|nr:argininosuccinate lyase [Halanaerobium saccharolyticum]TDP84428.1 argininosuccinate lyase [Halanaerobium saccharolyticum]